MKKINEIIIVEGQKDFNFLKSFLDADIVKTEGTSLPGNVVNALLEYRRKGKEFIILTDPDGPGEQIRRALKTLLPEAKHAFIDAKKSKYKNKVGVEHTSKQEVLQALENMVTFIDDKKTLEYGEFFDLGLIGERDSSSLRNKLATYLRIGRGSAKTIFKRLNMLGYNQDQLKKLILEVKQDESCCGSNDADTASV